MKKKTVLLVIIIFAVVFFMPQLTPVSADEYEVNIFEDLVYVDDSAYGSVQQITVPFQVAFHEKNSYQYDFPYSDDFFRHPCDQFSRLLAQGSMGLTVSAFNSDQAIVANQQATYLGAAGFSDIYTFGYGETSPESLSGVIAHKEIDDFTVIACVPCGQGYNKEWGGNLMVGDEERHVGFNLGATIFKNQIAQYKQSHNISGKVKLWITGFSRASAVSNITAADLLVSGEYESVYAYLFAVPRTTRIPRAYKGIFNICGKYDPVTCVPLQEWQFERYGTDLYTPSQETDSDYSALKPKASEIYRSIIGDNYRNNPEVNHQLHLILEFLGDLFPTQEDYADKVQGELMKIWTEADPARIIPILESAAEKLSELDKRTEYSSQVFLDYISYIASTYINDSRRQAEAGTWDVNASMAENFLREHQPLTYMSWIFCDAPIKDILDGNDYSRMVVFDGDLDVEVWREDVFLGSIDKEGKVIVANHMAQNSGNPIPEISMVRFGEETTLNLPMDAEYQIRLISDKSQTVMYYDYVYIVWIHEGFGDVENISRITEGTYEIRLGLWDDMPLMESISGEVQAAVSSPMEYSPLLTMAMESSSTEHLNLKQTMEDASRLGIFVAVLLLICLVIAIVHHRKKKKGHPPYSAWWVIVPHLIMIALFAFVTLFVTRHLSGIILAKNLAAGLAMLIIFLLALRAFIRRRCVSNLIIMAGMFVLMALSSLVYGKSMLGDYSILHSIIYCVCIIAFTLVVLFGFFRKKTVV